MGYDVDIGKYLYTGGKFPKRRQRETLQRLAYSDYCHHDCTELRNLKVNKVIILKVNK